MKSYILILISHLFFNIFHINTPSTNPLKGIEKKVIRIAKNKNIPTLQVAIQTQDDKLSFDYCNKAVNQQSIYGIGSVTKLLVAVYIFKLVEEKKLDINDKVVQYIPPIKDIEGFDQIIIKNLLNHTSGLADYTKHPEWITSVTNHKTPTTFEEKAALVQKKITNAGTFVYSNTNYLILEQIIESVTNTTAALALNQFYTDIGFSDITMDIPKNGLQSFFAQTAESNADVSKWEEHYGYDGGIYSNAKTTNRFLQKLMIESSIIKPETFFAMQEWIAMKPMTIPIGKGIINQYGYGIMKLTYNDQEYIGHFGGTLKYQSLILFNPKNQTTLSIFTNCSGRHYNNIFFQELIPAILDEL
ncbi:serine hydrolase domain-containing protein [Aquimarina algicola]|uniref:Beta-lactamase family protein n=1 Tax=Aquimarina algicola TaxID=2589995 RepID=A0A504J1L7_9FLAO|nr:serine hydrolase domain-containing protein [Aquimarina algicola]TPN84737.1 beta-lactamase family protein [Aquimarina algicola]